MGDTSLCSYYEIHFRQMDALTSLASIHSLPFHSAAQQQWRASTLHAGQLVSPKNAKNAENAKKSRLIEFFR
jgi:hypothetical protein